MRPSRVIAGLLTLLASAPALALQSPKLGALARMPIKEVTVFKDGHALMVHEGRLPVQQDGTILMDYLPLPVLGTFWVYGASPSVKPVSVTAGRRRVSVERTAMNTMELILANPGADVMVEERPGKPYRATIVGVPQRSAAEIEANLPPGADPQLPERSNAVLLKADSGVRLVPLERIAGLTFVKAPKTTCSQEEFRNVLTLRTAGGGAGDVPVGMGYLQRGLRWIPSYRISMDGKGGAVVKLQATLVNDMVDLKDVTANLVVGVPSFAFKDQMDPIALQEQAAQVASNFRSETRTGYMLSNAVMGQAMGRAPGGMGGYGGPGMAAEPDVTPGPEVSGQGRAEDLYVFTVAHVTLRKGERMVVPVSECTVKYRDVYSLDIAVAPPTEVRANLNDEQQRQIMALLAAPKVQHRLRFTNSSQVPFTTAPVLLVSGDRVIAQSMMTYTSVGGQVDITLTAAVDVKVKREETEAKRTPNALNWANSDFARVDLTGKMSLMNFRSDPVEIEVVRRVLGAVDEVGQGGTARMDSLFEVEASETPTWWGWYGWPGWWSNVNGRGRFSWTVTVQPGKTLDLDYSWHYFWR